jgi:hypothetical protein
MTRYCFALLAFVTSLAKPVQACSCAEYLTEAKEALAHSGLVFAGQVEKISVVVLPRVVYSQDEKGQLRPSAFLERRALVVFKVEKDWKAHGNERYTVLAGAPPEQPLKEGQVLVDCDVHFEVGKHYLVFTTDGYPDANPCAPTAELVGSASMVAALDRSPGN